MKNINTLIRKNIRQLKPYISAREQYNNKEYIFLDANENPYASGLNRYPDPQQKLVKNIISKRNNIPTNQIALGNGSDELLDLIIRVFCNPAIDNIIITPPTFGIYKVLANANNVAIREAPLTYNFGLDTASIINLVDKHTKIIFICSPNNPTGNLMDENSIKELLALNCIIVIDEAYIEFTTQKSWSLHLNDYPNLMVCQTLSKAWALAGIRVGMCFSSAEITACLNKIRLPYNLNVLSQQKAIEILLNPAQFKIDVNAIKQEKEVLIKQLLLMPIVETIYPSDANFLLVKFTDATQVFSHLVKEGIVVRNFSQAKGCENSLRISVGTTNENKKLIRSLQKTTP